MDPISLLLQTHELLLSSLLSLSFLQLAMPLRRPAQFTIRTPGTPARWAQYEQEFAALFAELDALVDAHGCPLPPPATSAAVGGSSSAGAGCAGAGAGAAWPAEACERGLDLALAVFFYWVNFGPLSRGTAATGYTLLHALLAALGWAVELPWLPPQRQLDWEAILRPSPAAFGAAVKPWLRPKLTRVSEAASAAAAGAAGARSTLGAAFSAAFGEAPSVDATIGTLRDAFAVLNHPTQAT